MKHSASFIVRGAAAAGLLLLACIGPGLTEAQARRPWASTPDLIHRSTTIVIGKLIAEAGDKSNGQVEVLKVLRGDTTAKTLVIVPGDESLSALDGSIFINDRLRSHIPVGGEAIFMGQLSSEGKLVLLFDGAGTLPLTDQNRTEVIEAAKKLMEIDAIKEPQDRAMKILALVMGENETLQLAAQQYLDTAWHFIAKDIAPCRSLITQLLNHPNPKAQCLGISMLRETKLPELVPRLIALSRSDSLLVTGSACHSLRLYDTPETCGVLIALSREHKHSSMRQAAVEALGASTRPEAQAAVLQAMDDPYDRVRFYAILACKPWLSQEGGEILTRRVIALLNDRDENVRRIAADALGNATSVESTSALLTFAKAQKPKSEAELSALASLAQQSLKSGNPSTRGLIDAELPWLIGIVRRDDGRKDLESYYPAIDLLRLSTKPEARAALEWASQSHGYENIRIAAKQALNKPKDK